MSWYKITPIQNPTTTAVAKTATPAQKTSAKKIAIIAAAVIGTLAAAAGLVFALRSGVTPSAMPKCPIGSDEAFVASKAFAAAHCFPASPKMFGTTVSNVTAQPTCPTNVCPQTHIIYSN